MTTFAPKTPTPSIRHFGGQANSLSHGHSHNEWRCKHCRKLLGVFRDGQIHLRGGGGHEYLASLPVRAICRECKTLNQKSVV
ncbi:hypothetical protein [Neogemmobacter tilapiae]|uniref:hypothetical protein n=1 Tax=Neogemmobacter tilapiae TaxID=875041 RepID=UPI0016737BB1|nr:hypothetical protein [Gemmobacter tilapiae]